MSNARNLANLLNTSGEIESNKLDDNAVHGRRNLIINGAMQVAQRGTSSTSAGGYYTVDRIYWAKNNTDQLAVTTSQSSVSPEGFSNSWRFQVTTAETALADDELVYFLYPIEAQDVQHLKYGTSNAQKVTLSFWVRSSLTGTYSVLFYINDDVRGTTHTYTVNTADTWEYKTITIDGDTTGVIDNNNGVGYSLYFSLSAGANNKGTGSTSWNAYTASDFADSNQVDFAAQTGSYYITGLQLEVGNSASPFEHRSHGEELALCQRYYSVLVDGSQQDDEHIENGYGWQTSQVEVIVRYPVEMRAAPTLKQGSTTDGIRWRINNTTHDVTTLNSYQASRRSMLLYATGESGVVEGKSYRVILNADSGAYIHFDAEL